jgi:hypothetical protein
MPEIEMTFSMRYEALMAMNVKISLLEYGRMQLTVGTCCLHLWRAYKRAAFVSKTMKASYLLPKNFWDMILGPLGYVVPKLSIAFAPRLLKLSPLRLLIT